MIKLPVGGFDSFAMRRPPFGSEVELFFFPPGVDIVKLLNSYIKGFFLDDDAAESIDSYIVDSFGDEDPNSSNGDKLAVWMEKDLGVDSQKTEKICNALFSWNLVVVKLEPDFDAIVPKYQGEVVLRDPYKRDIRVNQSENSDDTLLDVFDPMRDAIRNNLDRSRKIR